MFEDLMADAASGRGADDHVISLTSGVTAGLSRRRYGQCSFFTEKCCVLRPR
jgi:hypothetical protein